MACRTHAVLAAALLVATLAGCASAAPEPPVESETVGSSASPEPTPTPEPSPEPTRFTTQNGTASFLVPDGWTVEDTSLLDPLSAHGGPVWQNSVALLDADGVRRATYGDGYSDDVGAADERELVRSIPMAHGLHAAAWWSSTLDGEMWLATATVVHDLESPGTSFLADGLDRLHHFGADLSTVPECASVVDEASAVACLEAPGTTVALELLATLELVAVPWDAMPEGVDPQADVPWVDHASPDGGVAFSHPASWWVKPPIVTEPGVHVATLMTPDGYEALVVRHSTARPQDAASTCPPSSGRGPLTILAAEAVHPVADPALDPGPLELATFDVEAGDVGLAILPAERVEQGCFDPLIPVGEGSVQLSTPYGTDAPGMIDDRFPGGVGFVGSYEHEVMLEVARSLEVRP
ncbi:MULTISPECIES: hypothetical protein [unclassified Agrococcus]|uniref:hypothetical protein n=1 Tax=unclassified Agrococcus TaxID=2615065 RepID=UPI0036144C73